jgi:hypothetical protein
MEGSENVIGTMSSPQLESGYSAAARPQTRRRDWQNIELNPVLVKELRQAVRSRVLTSAVMTLLVAMFLAAAAFLVRHGFIPDQDAELGLPVFRAFLGILTTASAFFLPLFICLRLAAERREGGLDLMFITAMKPGEIVMGKLLCGGCLCLLFLCVCMPFMAFTNLLRGLDLPTVLFVLVCLYSVVWLELQVGIVIACVPAVAAVKMFVLFIYALLLGLGAYGLFVFFSMLVGSGVASTMGSVHFWVGFAVFLAIIGGVIRVFYKMSVSLIINDTRPRGYYDELIRSQPVECV